jgi:hypothetical protein
VFVSAVCLTQSTYCERVFQMNHIELALLEKESQRLKEDYQRCEDERLKEYIMEDIVLIEHVINISVREAKSKV